MAGILPGNNHLVTAQEMQRALGNYLYCDFMISGYNQYPWDFYNIAANGTSGTIEAVTATSPNHPGIIRMLSGTTLNSGGAFRTSGSAILLGGYEMGCDVFQTAPDQSIVIRRIGFQYNVGLPTAVTKEGAYVEINAGIMTGYTTANTAITGTTSTTYTLSNSTFYRLVVDILPGATDVVFTLYLADSIDPLWQETIVGTVPHTTGLTVGFHDVAIITTTPTVRTSLGCIDFMSVWLPQSLRRTA